MGRQVGAATKGRMIRLFTALPIPDDVVETLRRRQAGLPGAKWRTANQLHITLAFYGEIDERRADDLAAELNRAATGGPFEIALRGVGGGGEAHRVETLWAAVEASERLTVLAGRCRAAAERVGVVMDKRAYRPHLTLAYLKPRTNPDRIGAWIAGHNLLHSPPLPVNQFGLYSSVLGGGGSVYTLEQEYLL